MSQHTQTTLTGRFQGSERGFGFFLPEGGGQDLFVPPRQTLGAWDGDRVEAVPAGEDPRRPGSPTARVTAILERANSTVTGIVRKIDRGLWLEPDNRRLPAVKLTGKARVKNGTRAAVAVSHYGSETTPPLGSPERVFGPAEDLPAAVEAILYRENIHRQFPTEVLAQAAQMPRSVPQEALEGRLDLRGETIITIDGAASKDLDDAVSLEKLENGWRLGVHIADVSAYVPAGSALDAEAFERGTSVYFADQVVPMLPVELSNGICSLNEGVDRLTLSCLMTLDDKGAVIDYTIAPSVICSTHRMTYGDCNALLAGPGRLGTAAPTEGQEGIPGETAYSQLAGRYSDILPMLRDMAALAGVLERGRRRRGALDLESRESYILCDEEGVPVDVVTHEPGVSEGVIESFMLIANETVAAHLGQSGLPGVYRVHEKPTAEKTEALRTMLSPLGIPLRQGDSFELQKVLDTVKDTPQAPAVSMMVLRSLMKARYAPEDLGHFGLGAKHYCHFTSPIRRYPDLMVHRVLHSQWERGGAKVLAGACAQAADQSSRRELSAQSAERDIEKLYFARFMADHIGETFPALVSGVTRQGLFAALPSGVEGFLPLESLPGGRYQYDEDHLTLSGPEVTYTFGSPLEVVCVLAEAATGRVEFALAGAEVRPETGKTAARPKPPRAGRAAKPAPKKAGGKAAGGKGRGGKRSMHVPKRRKG